MTVFCNTKKCGCEDKGLHSVCPACTNVDCPAPDPCPEVFYTDCIIFSGNDIPSLYIENGDTLTEILQIMATESTDCKRMIMNLHTTAITTTTIALAWVVEGTYTDLEINYSTDNLNWTSNGLLSATAYTDTISSLTADTEYYIKATINPGEGECDSVTILVKTNALT